MPPPPDSWPRNRCEADPHRPSNRWRWIRCCHRHSPRWLPMRWHSPRWPRSHPHSHRCRWSRHSIPRRSHCRCHRRWHRRPSCTVGGAVGAAVIAGSGVGLVTDLCRGFESVIDRQRVVIPPLCVPGLQSHLEGDFTARVLGRSDVDGDITVAGGNGFQGHGLRRGVHRDLRCLRGLRLPALLGSGRCRASERR